MLTLLRHSHGAGLGPHTLLIIRPGTENKDDQMEDKDDQMGRTLCKGFEKDWCHTFYCQPQIEMWSIRFVTDLSENKESWFLKMPFKVAILH